MCCSDTQGWLGFPWPPKRGWAKTCATLPWPVSGWSMRFLFFLLRCAAQCGGSGRQGLEGAQRPESDRRERPLTQERPEHYIASPSSRKNSSGQTQARAAAPERARPRRLPGHGKPSTAPRLPQHRARQATDARQPAGAHTTAAATRPSSGPPGRGQARPASATRARAQRWPIPSVSLRCAIYCITEIDYIIV